MDGRYRDRTVLVTGGAGAIGSRLVKRLVEYNADVIVLDDLSSGYRFNLPEECAFVQGDVADPDIIAEVMAEKPEIIFHLAAFFANQNSIDHPRADLSTNGHGIVNMLEHCIKEPATERFIYASSSCAYDSDEQLPFTESKEVTLDFQTPYEITKTLGEAYCNYYQTHGNIETVSARIFNSYGPGEVPGKYRNVIPKFVYYGMQNKSLPITGSGDETRDFTYVDDIVEGLLSMGVVKRELADLYNLASGRETTIKELAAIINDITGNETGIEYHPRRDWDEVDRRRGSIKKARTELNYEPTIDIETGIQRTVEWFESNWKSILEHSEFE
jgi:nucleoside-diphosphate-sugar epimerase